MHICVCVCVCTCVLSIFPVVEIEVPGLCLVRVDWGDLSVASDSMLEYIFRPQRHLKGPVVKVLK